MAVAKSGEGASPRAKIPPSRRLRATVRRLNLECPADGAALLDLLDHYARDPMGGGEALAPAVRADLLGRLAATPHYLGALAFIDGRAVGLINCFFGFSTFAARPLLNVHDLVVRDGARGAGVGQALLAWAEAEARAAGCCKLTLEVLTGNVVARRAYGRAGFQPYELDPAAGQAVLLQKKIG